MVRWRTVNETAWVLRKRPFGETDALLDLYGQTLGRFTARAPAARKPGARKAGHVDLFSEVRLGLARGQNWWIVTQAESRTWFPELRASVRAYLAASTVGELVLRAVPEGERLPGLYPLLAQSFRAIARHPQGPRWVPRIAAWAIVRLAGFGPDWTRCTRCGVPLHPGRPKYVDIREGGLRCADCGSSGFPRLSDRAWAVLRFWQMAPFAKALEHLPDEALYAELEAVETAYLRHWLEQSLQAWQVRPDDPPLAAQEFGTNRPFEPAIALAEMPVRTALGQDASTMFTP